MRAVFAGMIIAFAGYGLLNVLSSTISVTTPAQLPAVQSPSGQTSARQVQAQEQAPERSQPPRQRSGGVLTATEVRSWCRDGELSACADHEFEELNEGGNTIVHMTTGHAVAFAVPDGVSVDAWSPSGNAGCDTTTHPKGATTFEACEATFRRFS